MDSSNVRDPACEASLAERKYFNISYKTFVKRTLRRLEWTTTSTGILVVPSTTLRYRLENAAACLEYLAGTNNSVPAGAGRRGYSHGTPRNGPRPSRTPCNKGNNPQTPPRNAPPPPKSRSEPPLPPPPVQLSSRAAASRRHLATPPGLIITGPFTNYTNSKDLTGPGT